MSMMYVRCEDVEPYKTIDDGYQWSFYNDQLYRTNTQESVLAHYDTSIVLKSGRDDIYWFYNNQLHRIGGPAYIGHDGHKEWYFLGKLHREDGPAIISPSGDEQWYYNDKIHRADGPSIIAKNGTQIWYLNGLCHRVDGPAYIGYDGHKEWYFLGKLHREDGPAIIDADGTIAWLQHGFYHNPNPTEPAIKFPYSNRKTDYRFPHDRCKLNSRYEWFGDNNVNITVDVINWIKENKIRYPFNDQVRIEFILRFR
jgi:hypothetical protein